uniref:Uncharacterized protein n=1 Tax=Sphaerodactylus townsendi TaxID=933632 RepID=A0ACB8EFY5_9SAUR
MKGKLVLPSPHHLSFPPSCDCLLRAPNESHSGGGVCYKLLTSAPCPASLVGSLLPKEGKEAAGAILSRLEKSKRLLNLLRKLQQHNLHHRHIFVFFYVSSIN